MQMLWEITYIAQHMVVLFVNQNNMWLLQHSVTLGNIVNKLYVNSG